MVESKAGIAELSLLTLFQCEVMGPSLCYFWVLSAPLHHVPI